MVLATQRSYLWFFVLLKTCETNNCGETNMGGSISIMSVIGQFGTKVHIQDPDLAHIFCGGHAHIVGGFAYFEIFLIIISVHIIFFEEK